MRYEPKPMPFDPKSISGISEKVLVSHYENNYGGAVKWLNAIGAQLAELDFAKAPNFLINGLKREELIATNSMILHEIYFDGLGGSERPSGALADAIARDFGSIERCLVVIDFQTRTPIDFHGAVRPGEFPVASNTVSLA